MKVYYDLRHVNDYVKLQSHPTIEEMEAIFNSIMKRVKNFKEINQDSKILEVGTGTGWFPILCKKNGISCQGIEICPQLVEYSTQYGRRIGIQPDIGLGNIEEADIGISKYDVVIATSTFEHVEHWKKGIRNIFNALKTGGLFYFYSTNKFSLWSGEAPLPFYGWLPNNWRYHIRIARTGEDIMKLGIDFNQFNYFQLRRFFLDIGFTQIVDQFEIIDFDNLFHSSICKKIILKMIKGLKPIKLMALIFSPGTLFICIK
jgi:2-polyprenyl-3-methyl-5-hydroxy-6-metoxy-1,4-benzoquinol methylase